ncbi:acyltransferase [Pedobacter frigiditerrae]|uniref:acyltransferase n=1 Tax=Pedobacter frigiditerrae TaxID=2530452 RepID=UPI00292CC3EB|nr:acyltransferase [Pedobacter frigiditerrae]
MKSTQNFAAKIIYRFRTLRNGFRRFYLRLQGLTTGEGTFLGKIDIEWPGSVAFGKNCTVQNNIAFWVQSPFNASNRITIGDNVFIGRNTEFNCCDFIKIGDNCLIASAVVFVDSAHTFAKEGIISKQPTKLKGIVVEEDVWIGTGAKILQGVHLCQGCIIGAGAVVNKRVPAYEIWAGVPAVKIGERKDSKYSNQH